MRSTKDFIIKASQIHNKYDYSKVNYKNSHTKIIIGCPIHGDFEQLPYHHLNGHGCNKCGIDKLRAKDFIIKAKKIHKYNYSKVNYKNSYTKVIIICEKHGEFLQTPKHHLNGYGCNKCVIDNVFISKSNIIHKNKYDYSKIEYKNNKTKITIICPIHGKFSQLPLSHLKGFGCSKCSNNKKKTSKSFIKEAKKIHKYDYSKVNYKNSHTKIIIICEKHGEFLQAPNHHLKGCGCPKCCSNVSKISQQWLDYLNIPKKYREVLVKYNDKQYLVDAYDNKTNTVYEFNGDFWHGNPRIYNLDEINPITKTTFGELYRNTLEKKNNLKENYNIIDIWEDEWIKLCRRKI